MYYRQILKERQVSIVAKCELKYTFHNPNSVEKTAEVLVKLFVEANKPKVDEAVKSLAEKGDDKLGHSA